MASCEAVKAENLSTMIMGFAHFGQRKQAGWAGEPEHIQLLRVTLSVMSIFTKPLSQLGTADLQELLNDGAVENARLEFKLQVPNKEDTLKKLSSFPNTFGGFMVIGAKADSTDGRIQDLSGVDVVAGYKQKVVQWCLDSASPPLVVEVSDPIPAPSDNSKFCYVAYTAESDVAPHFLNGRKGIWVRTDEFSARFEAHLATENELRHLFDRRKSGFGSLLLKCGLIQRVN